MLKQFFRSICLFLFVFVLFNPISNAEQIDLDYLLVEAVAHDDVQAAQDALEHSANVNAAAKYNEGISLLTTAIEQNSTEMVKLLLEYKADPNVYTQNTTTPLLKAIEMQNPEIVQLLIEAGAKVNSELASQTPALVYSIEKFQPENGLTIFRYLLDNNADVNAKATNGVTALMLAANNDTDNQEFMCTIARELIRKGANRNLRDDSNKTALQYATDINFTTMMNILRASPKGKVKTGLMVPIPVKVK